MKHVLASVFALGITTGTDAPAGSYNGLEIPAYTVETRDGAIELRRYAPYLAAEVQVDGSQNSAGGKAFRMLAGFIFGDNTPNEKIAMTAPVTQSQGTKIAMTAPVTQEQNDGLWTVRFMMPRQYTRDTLPAPINPAVAIVDVPASTRLVAVFSGMTPPSVVARKAEALQSYAAARELTLLGPPELARYNDPFTPPWNRRNEVSFAVQ